MDAKELREMAEKVAAASFNDAGNYIALRQQLARLVSHVESEMRVAEQREKRITLLESMMERHDRILLGDSADLESHPGLAFDVASIKTQSKRNGKLLQAVLVGVVLNYVPVVIKLLGTVK